MPLKGIQDTARTLSYYAKLQSVIGNNLANVSTSGFKADRLSAFQLPGTNAPVPVSDLDLRQGTFRETGRKLDLALDGPGFFTILTESGERYTRGGSFRLDDTGTLTDMHGNVVAGVDGPIVVTEGEINVDSNGTVTVDGQEAGRLKLVDIVDTGALSKEGANLFVVADGTEPVEASGASVIQGAVEESNIDPMLGMVDLISIQRAYSANMRALRVMDGLLSTAANDVGRVQG